MIFFSRYKLIFLSIVTILFLGLLSVTFVYSYIKNNLILEKTETFKTFVFVKSEEVKSVLNSVDYLLTNVKNDEAIEVYLSQSDRKKQDEVLLKNLDSYNIANLFSAIYVMDINGNTLVSTDPSFVGNNYSFRDYFSEALKTGYSFDAVLGVTTNQLGYYFSTRIEDSQNNILGIVTLKLRPEVVEKKLSSINLENNSSVMLLDKYGVIIYSNKLERLYNTLGVLDEDVKQKIVVDKRFLEKQLDSVWDFPVDDLNTNLSDVNFFEYKNKKGKTNIYYTQVGNYNLFFSIEQPAIVQLASILKIVNTASLVIFSAAFLAIVIILLLLINYLKPIKILYEAALKVSHGNYKSVIEYNSNFSEMQELILAFNMMSASVKKVHEEIEQKVQTQTQKIIEKQVFLEEQKKALINVLEDINEEKEKTEGLSRELEKFKFAVDNASDHIVITDPDGMLLFANKAVNRITGYNEKEVLGTKAGKIWGGIMDKDFYKKLWSTIKKQKKVFAGELLNKRKNGEVYPAEVSITPLLSSENEVQFFLGIERDITKRKKDEEKLQLVLKDLKEQDFQLAEEKAKYEALLASISSGIIVTNEKGKMILVNKAAEEMLNIKSSQIKNKEIYSFLKIYDEKGKSIKKENRPIYKALISGEKQTAPIGETYYYKHGDGSLFPVGIMASPFIWMEKIIGSILVFRDISYEQSIDKSKTEFVSLASHQLRTPLSTINWYVEMLLDEDAGSLNDEQRDYLKEVDVGNKRMVDLVNSLLNVSRIELGTFAIDPEKIDIRDIFDSVIKELEPQILQKKMKITKKYDKRITKLNLDQKLIRMVIQNLITNAVKYTPDKGQIKIEIQKNEKELVMSVKDNGYGIPKNQQDNIFTKMFRADNVKLKDTTGTGLGLYIVKSIIEQSAGGKIWFDSIENKGTTFYFTIPLKGMIKKEGNKALT
ncbi:MAG: PAS domain S-box protein [Patescibacteria group bacterium]|nr:PAS domain S-box protein [Patescibacteria group bacterium]